MIATLQKNARLISRLEIITGLIAVAVFALVPIIAFHSYRFVTLQLLKVAFVAWLAIKYYDKDADSVRWVVTAMIVSVVTDSAWVNR